MNYGRTYEREVRDTFNDRGYDSGRGYGYGYGYDGDRYGYMPYDGYDRMSGYESPGSYYPPYGYGFYYR